jgi:protein-L-isoaspartate(D-aspartate) O-methyltransferase
MYRDQIDDNVQEILDSLPRKRFLMPEYHDRAGIDQPLPIGFGQTISQPTVVAIMTTALELTGTEKVLEIGTGSGFQTAVLAKLCRVVHTIEIIEALSLRAHALLDDLGYNNIHFRIGDGHDGWPDAAPFDRIICTAAPPELPTDLFMQLSDPSIMVAPIGSNVQELFRIRRSGVNFDDEPLGGVRFVPMVRGN